MEEVVSLEIAGRALPPAFGYSPQWPVGRYPGPDPAKHPKKALCLHYGIGQSYGYSVLARQSENLGLHGISMVAAILKIVRGSIDNVEDAVHACGA
jgi:hypothetical protein